MFIQTVDAHDFCDELYRLFLKITYEGFEEYLAGDRGLQDPGLRVYILWGVGGFAPHMFSNKKIKIQKYVILRNEPYTIAILLYCDISSVNLHLQSYYLRMRLVREV